MRSTTLVMYRPTHVTAPEPPPKSAPRRGMFVMGIWLSLCSAAGGMIPKLSGDVASLARSALATRTVQRRDARAAATERVELLVEDVARAPEDPPPARPIAVRPATPRAGRSPLPVIAGPDFEASFRETP